MISTLGGGPLAPMGRWADEKWRFGQENLMVQPAICQKQAGSSQKSSSEKKTQWLFRPMKVNI